MTIYPPQTQVEALRFRAQYDENAVKKKHQKNEHYFLKMEN